MNSGAQTPAEYAFWRTPDAAMTVVYSLALFHEIDFVVNEGYRRIPHGGVEVGGLLFGRKEPSRIRLEAFRGIECEHAFGPSFVLSERDLEKIRTHLSTFTADPELQGLEALGWFVAHSRSALEMSEREVAWFDGFFPEPGKVAVLAKPERFQPTRFSFVVRRQDGQLQHPAATDAIILPLTGRARGPQDGQSEEGMIPSVPAPMPTSPVRAASPVAQSTTIARPPEPAAPPAEPITSAPPPVPPQAPLRVRAPESHDALPFKPASEPAIPLKPATPPKAPVPEQIPLRPAEPVSPATASPQSAKLPDTPHQTVPPLHGIETRPLTAPKLAELPSKLPEREQLSPKWPAVPKPAGPQAPVPPAVPAAREQGTNPAMHDETVEMPRVPTLPPRESKPPAQTEQIWRQRVEALPLRPAPHVLASKSPQIAREPGIETRGLDVSAAPRPRRPLFFLIAALLGCVVGYFAYLQLPPPVIPLTVKPRGAGLVVSWPATQTEHVSQATLQVGAAQPVSLSPAERSAGQAAVAALGNDIKIELVAHHWPRDSRGIVRFVRSAGSTATVQ